MSSILIDNNDGLKSELNQIFGYMLAGNDMSKEKFPEFIKLLNNINSNSNKLNAVTIYPSNIDLRKIKCACGKDDCKIGLNFDSGSNIMFLNDKYNNEHAMYLDVLNVNEIKEHLAEFTNLDFINKNNG